MVIEPDAIDVPGTERAQAPGEAITIRLAGQQLQRATLVGLEMMLDLANGTDRVMGRVIDAGMGWTAGLLGLLPVPCFSNGNVVDSGAINYETEPMAEDYYLNGPIEADIWMATTAIDAGLSVRVDDVAPNGRVTPLTNGLQTASLRAVDERRSRKLDGQSIQPWHPFTQESVLPVGVNTPVMVPVEVFQTSALIAKGHRLRIAVSASNLPQGVPPIPTLLQSLAGVLTIYSDAARPSSVVIPVVPASALTSG